MSVSDNKLTFTLKENDMEPKIQLLYDYEILNIAKQESLALLPMVHNLREKYPDALWEDVEHTITAYVYEHGFDGVPTSIVPKPVEEPEPEPEPEVVEDPVAEEPLVIAPPVEHEEFEDFHNLPSKKPSTINVRNILQEIKGKV